LDHVLKPLCIDAAILRIPYPGRTHPQCAARVQQGFCVGLAPAETSKSLCVSPNLTEDRALAAPKSVSVHLIGQGAVAAGVDLSPWSNAWSERRVLES
jgi:hypothetical protein